MSWLHLKGELIHTILSPLTDSLCCNTLNRVFTTLHVRNTLDSILPNITGKADYVNYILNNNKVETDVDFNSA